MNAYSKDLRLKVLAAMDRGECQKEISRLFGVSLATIGRYVKRRRETGEVAPRPSPGRTPLIGATAEQRRALWAQLEAHDDATLNQHCELWEGEQGMRVSISTMSRAMSRVGWTLKKRRWALPRETKRQGALGGSR